MAVDSYYEDYEPTKAGRAIADFVDAHLSNWYVRLSRRRFWKGDYTTDKISAYQTLYTCLESVAILIAPIAPFFSDRLFTDLNSITSRNKATSVHLADFAKADEQLIDKSLEERMQLAQKISSMVLSLRKQHRIRVRQPLSRIMIPASDESFKEQVEAVKGLITSEVNVKNIEYISGQGILVKKVKANFKALGPRYGKLMKQIAAELVNIGQSGIAQYEAEGKLNLNIQGEQVQLVEGDLEVITEDIPGWVVATEGSLTVALDVSISEELRQEGIARELINRIQNIRKDLGFEVTDKIAIEVVKNNGLSDALMNNYSYICSETLAESFRFTDAIEPAKSINVELTDNLQATVSVQKL
ncbi:Isoleucine--tRNA ligase [anaerobic digester metagenome]